MENRRITIRKVAEDVGIYKLLNFDQKHRRMSIVQQLFNDVNGDPDLFKWDITGDESWAYDYDIETKVQSWQWKSPGEQRPNKEKIAERTQEHKKKCISELLRGLAKTLAQIYYI